MMEFTLLGPRSCFDVAQHERSFGHKTRQHLILSDVEGRGGAHQTKYEGAA